RPLPAYQAGEPTTPGRQSGNNGRRTGRVRRARWSSDRTALLRLPRRVRRAPPPTEVFDPTGSTRMARVRKPCSDRRRLAGISARNGWSNIQHAAAPIAGEGAGGPSRLLVPSPENREPSAENRNVIRPAAAAA